MTSGDGSTHHDPALKKAWLQDGFLLIVVTAITVLLVVMLRRFLVTVILAAVFSAMGRPAYDWLTGRLGGRKRMASLLMVLGLLLLIVIPLAGFLGLVLSQALQLSELAGPWLRDQSARWPELTAWLESLPLVGSVVPDRATVVGWASDGFGWAGGFLIDNLGAATSGAANLLLQLSVMLYAMYFFFTDGTALLSRLTYYIPLEEADERQLLERFSSVTRATIRGSILVGLIQGALAGAPFFIFGIPGAAFWTTVMAVLSVIPVVGSGIVWVPASVILATTGRPAAGIALALWGAVVVGWVDNFLRPRFVGRDAKMHDLLVLLSTLGGLAMFGLVGFIIGPIVAALFVTAWRLYGAAFQELLPVPAGGPPTDADAPDRPPASGPGETPGAEGASSDDAAPEETPEEPSGSSEGTPSAAPS